MTSDQWLLNACWARHADDNLRRDPLGTPDNANCSLRISRVCPVAVECQDLLDERGPTGAAWEAVLAMTVYKMSHGVSSVRIK